MDHGLKYFIPATIVWTLLWIILISSGLLSIAVFTICCWMIGAAYGQYLIEARNSPLDIYVDFDDNTTIVGAELILSWSNFYYLTLLIPYVFAIGTLSTGLFGALYLNLVLLSSMAVVLIVSIKYYNNTPKYYHAEDEV